MKNKFSYYNEFDPKAAAWLRELIKEGLIAYGEVDERSIVDVSAGDLRGFSQHHFFAGIGGWSYALRLSGWPDDFGVWTASLPCQPFSAAGKGLGKSDERHLLPHFLDLVRKCKPKTIFGEQVERAIRSTGLRDQTQDVQSLQTRAAYLRVLAELQRQGGKTLQELQSMGEKQQTREEGEKFSDLSGLENEESRCCLSEFRNSSSQRKRNGIGYNCGLGANKDRCGSMRGNRDIVRPSYAESVECAIIGQDRQQQRIHNNEYPCGDLCLECDDEYLGTAEDIGSVEWNNESAQEQINRAYRKVSEQIENTIAHGWLDDLQTTMEAEGYAVGHCVLGAHSVNSPHIRQRLYWVANSINYSSEPKITPINGETQGGEIIDRPNVSQPRESCRTSSDVCGLANTNFKRSEGREGTECSDKFTAWKDGMVNWVYCRDNKYRPIKPGIQPLVDGIPKGMVRGCDNSAPINANATQEARAMRLKGYGNAIVPQLAAQFIGAHMAIMGDK